MTADKESVNDFQDVASLPVSNAGLAEILTFLDAHDFAAKFRKLWGDDYAKNAQTLWQHCTQAIDEGGRIDLGPDELLLCLKYESAIAPYLPRPESQRTDFYRRVLAAVREKLA